MSSFIDSAKAFTELIDTSQQTPDGSLKGYDFGVKDVFEVKGFRIQAGNPEYFKQAKVAETTARAIAILQDAGARLIGKTQTDELGGSLFGINAHYGTPLNSSAPERVPGGSSSGSAAAVAASLVDFALGADTSGSVRAPASFCGIYGLRPTFGLIPTSGILPISAHLDTVGIFARDPQIISQILNVYGINNSAHFTQLRLIPSLIENLQGTLKNSFLEKLHLFKEFLPSIKQLDITEDQLTEWSNVIRTIAMHDLWQVHKEWILKENPTFGKIIKDRLKMGSSIQFEDYKRARQHQKNIKSFMENNLEPDDVVVFPTVHDIPPLLSTPLSQLKEFSLKTSRHTCIAALTGFPEITLPLKNIKNKCSLGMSFLGVTNADYPLASFASVIHSILNGEKYK